MTLLIEPPTSPPWYLRPMLWLTRRVTGKEPLPARLLTWFPRGAIGAGIFEALAPSSAHLDARVLVVARIVSSATAGCPFCLDMNAAAWARAGLARAELEGLLAGEVPTTLSVREAVAARYARSLSETPVRLDAALQRALVDAFTPREVVVLATTIAQVNYWSRFNQGLGVPAGGFFSESATCALPRSTTPS